MYKSVVTEVGDLALAFEEEKVSILFGPQAPQELKEIAIIHESIIADSEESIIEGGVFNVDDQQYKITAVGSAANTNLRELGHISIYFSEPELEILPGAVFVSPHVFPKYKNGSVIEFKG